MTRRKPYNEEVMFTSSRYGEALVWTEQLHRNQCRKGKDVPYISHLLAVSSLVWEDDGTEDQAIAALLHDAIEDSAQSHGSITERFGVAVANIVRDCTDTNEGYRGGEKEPWLLRKSRFLQSIAQLPDTSLLVIAADKAHNASDMVIDSGRDSTIWSRFTAGLEGSLWYLLRMHQQLHSRMPNSRSIERLADALNVIISTDTYLRLVPQGIEPAIWAAGYAERCDGAKA
ncbi:MAG: HD domain-containing protein [Prochlorococcus sp.]